MQTPFRVTASANPLACCLGGRPKDSERSMLAQTSGQWLWLPVGSFARPHTTLAAFAGALSWLGARDMVQKAPARQRSPHAPCWRGGAGVMPAGGGREPENGSVGTRARAMPLGSGPGCQK